jgi:hypothetical protein
MRRESTSARISNRDTSDTVCHRSVLHAQPGPAMAAMAMQAAAPALGSYRAGAGAALCRPRTTAAARHVTASQGTANAIDVKHPAGVSGGRRGPAPLHARCPVPGVSSATGTETAETAVEDGIDDAYVPSKLGRGVRLLRPQTEHDHMSYRPCGRSYRCAEEEEEEDAGARKRRRLGSWWLGRRISAYPWASAPLWWFIHSTSVEFVLRDPQTRLQGHMLAVGDANPANLWRRGVEGRRTRWGGSCTSLAHTRGLQTIRIRSLFGG